MKAHLTGYFLTYRSVYLLDSACRLLATILQICCSFSRIMFLKSNLFYFVLVAKDVRLLLASTSSELRSYIKCVTDC